MGLTRRAFVGGVAAGGAALALNPLRALAQGSSVPAEWTSYAQSLVNNPGPAVGYAIVAPGATPVASGLGLLQKGGTVDAASNTLFEIGSVTKVFTTILLAYTIAQKSSVSLDTTLGAYLPKAVKNSGVTDLTFGELATYSNGLRTDAPGQNSASYKMARLVRWLNGSKALLTPGFTAGTDYYYSNLAFGLLGYALGQIWGSSWQNALLNYVTGPLGMPDTIRGGTQSPDQQLRTATGYRSNGQPAPPLVNAPFLGGGGALVSTPNDMAAFIAQNLDPSSAPSALQGPLAAAQKLQQTFTMGIPEKHSPPPIKLKQPVSAGLGWFISETSSSQIGCTKNGGTIGFSSYVGYIPAQGVGIFLSTSAQKVNPQPKGNSILGLGPLSADAGGA